MTERELSRAAARRLAIIRHAEEVTRQRRSDVSVLRDLADALSTRGAAATRSSRSRGCATASSPAAHEPERDQRSRWSARSSTCARRYHFGPQKISMYLKRYHDLEVSTSGVWRILKRLDMNRLPASQRYRRHVDRWKRYEKPQPGHRVQIDVKFVAPLAVSPQEVQPVHGDRRLHPDPGPSDLRQVDQMTAIRFVDYVVEKLPFRRRGDSDRQRGRLPGRSSTTTSWTRGIGHVYIKPGDPAAQRQGRALTPDRS